MCKIHRVSAPCMEYVQSWATNTTGRHGRFVVRVCTSLALSSMSCVICPRCNPLNAYPLPLNFTYQPLDALNFVGRVLFFFPNSQALSRLVRFWALPMLIGSSHVQKPAWYYSNPYVEREGESPHKAICPSRGPVLWDWKRDGWMEGF